MKKIYLIMLSFLLVIFFSLNSDNVIKSKALSSGDFKLTSYSQLPDDIRSQTGFYSTFGSYTQAYLDVCSTEIAKDWRVILSYNSISLSSAQVQTLKNFSASYNINSSLFGDSVVKVTTVVESSFAFIVFNYSYADSSIPLPSSFFNLDLDLDDFTVFKIPSFFFDTAEYKNILAPYSTLATVDCTSFSFEIRFARLYSASIVALGRTSVCFNGLDSDFKYFIFLDDFQVTSGVPFGAFRLDYLGGSHKFETIKYDLLDVDIKLPVLSSFTDLSSRGLEIYLSFAGINLFSSLNLVSTSDLGINPNYKTCKIYDIPCHLGNALVYLVYEFPLTKGIAQLFLSVVSLVEKFFNFLTSFSSLGFVFAISVGVLSLLVLKKLIS